MVMQLPCPPKRSMMTKWRVESSLRMGPGSGPLFEECRQWGRERGHGSWFIALCFANVSTTMTSLQKNGKVCKQSDLI